MTSIDDDASRKAAPLTMRSLDQVEDYFMPFDLEVDGFTDGWWDNRVGRVGTSHYDWLSFERDGVEVARAEVDYTATLGGEYLGRPLPRDVVDIPFLEVREGYRGGGIGRRAVDLITAKYAGSLLIAFSEQADEFWTAVGWQRRPRLDSDTMYRRLVVWDGRAE
ncbi:GCN5 family acetyltransferase [Microbacterium sp. zg.B48]|uniref:GCN5 family acetyltransferase n=1 Tax=Microbacterium sp. zg.B48 TaxID=2969408 RepID=UPI00214AA3C6|nr:GCN5 family acetyltransferase [Microbacterium sp. zg.B48]MCR2763841.1 GCN5 family acetyltransferase [Microbacterium sp. zg.B48]